ncbi:MAG TPA: AAA family ATPase [Rhodothermales bacterium]|nr:AAA family ATPase [Rhodothermales bacterium]
MSVSSARVFEDAPAVRQRVPLIVNIVGPSGSGKTYSALRLATGFQKVTGGDVYVVDTEAKRSLHYADRFKFRHVPFSAPFGPLDYLAAVEHCVKKGAGTVVIDSASHLHEGPGGVLEMHEAECQRLSEQWRQTRDKVQIAAWQKPKSELRRFINSILQMPVNLILCLRAKEKLKVVAGGKPQPLGFMPIASDELVYEATVSCLLYPGSKGVPAWHPEEMGEKGIVKLPAQFDGFFPKGAALSEDVGAKLAEWAAGGGPAPKPANDGERAWMPRLKAALAALKLGVAQANEQGLRGEARTALIRTEALRYVSWCAGRDVTDINGLTDEEADTVIRRAELGEMPE